MCIPRFLPFLVAAMLLLATAAKAQSPRIEISRSVSGLETLAAHEVSRYLYARTGAVPEIARTDGPTQNHTIVIARRDRELLRAVAVGGLSSQIAALKPQNYLLKTLNGRDGRKTHLIIGGDDAGVLYGAYRFAELLGVRFYLHGDVVPDERISTSVPTMNEIGVPLFPIRGIQPFHDFPEGPDWWNRDDYLAPISQLPKLRMNFIGLHSYPEGSAGPEPAVWIGQRGDSDQKGRVSFSYPIVPTVRSLVARGESLSLKVIMLSPQDGPRPTGSLFWRPLQQGAKQGRFRRIPLTLPSLKAGDSRFNESCWKNQTDTLSASVLPENPVGSHLSVCPTAS